MTRGRPPREVKRVQIALRLEPDLLAEIDRARPETQQRHAKIIKLIRLGLGRDG